LPKRIVVFGLSIKVIETNQMMVIKNDIYDPEVSLGMFDPFQPAILVNKNLSNKTKTQVFFHELIHAIEFRLGMHQTDYNFDLGEIRAEGISNVLVELFDFRLK